MHFKSNPSTKHAMGALIAQRCCPAPPYALGTALASIARQRQHQTIVSSSCTSRRTLVAAAAAAGVPPAPATTAQFAAAGDQGSSRPLPRVVLKGGKTKLFTGESPSPMVYSGAVDRVVGRPAPKAGDVVLVCDGSEKAIGWGVFNPESMFRVRVMQLADECFGGSSALAAGQSRPDLPQLVSSRIQQAVALRAALGLSCAGSGDGAQQAQQGGTSVFRAVNSEGDRLSGLVVDVLGQHLVVSSSAAWVERHRDTITECLERNTGLSSITWRPSLEMLREEGSLPPGAEAAEPAAEAGLEAAPAADAAVEEAEPAQQAAAPRQTSSTGEPPESADLEMETVVVAENGIQYAAAPLGQKTGFYADQRDNRLALRHLAGGRRVLDLCCYSGGFALNAAAGGAAQVTGVDSSAFAVALAERNAELNGVGGVCGFVRSDVGDFLKQALAAGQRWDVVVFDPPKLAPSRKSLEKATRKYRKLNAMAMKLVEPGGLLMTCSCSGAMSQSGQFVPTLQAAARDAGRRITVLRVAGAGADHPVDPCYPEGQYLTNVLLRVV